jgi:Pyruvate/2-oxoacid:ferredoxin oxidoreductase delta subunit
MCGASCNGGMMMVMIRTNLPRIKVDITHNYDFCKGCGICSKIACERKVWEMIKDETKLTETVARISEKSSSRCAGCGYCELLCPDQAIHVHGAWGVNI